MDGTEVWCKKSYTSPQIQWKSQTMAELSKAKSSTHKASAQRPTLNNILPKLYNAQDLSLIDVSSGYHNIKLDRKSSYLTTFACQFGRCRYKRLLFGAAPAGDIFQRKIDEIFKELPNVFDIADDILVVGYDVDGKGHDDTL